MSLVKIYVDYIKLQGDFDYGIDLLEKIGLKGILGTYSLDIEELSTDEKEELWNELKQMAEENDFIREFEKINLKG